MQQAAYLHMMSIGVAAMILQDAARSSNWSRRSQRCWIQQKDQQQQQHSA
jgi:hypothetical protein